MDEMRAEIQDLDDECVADLTFNELARIADAVQDFRLSMQDLVLEGMEAEQLKRRRRERGRRRTT